MSSQQNEMQRGLFIGGRWVAGDGSSLPVIDPCTEQELTRVDTASDAQVDLAVQRALAAQREMRDVSGAVRAEWLRQLAASVAESKERLAELESRNVGKPYVGSIARRRRYRNVPRVLRNAGVGSGRASGHLTRRAARGFRSARTPRADRRVCIDYPMEFSFADRRVEAGAGTRRRVREHPEAFGVHAAHCARACRLDRADEIAARPRVSAERARSHGGRDAVSTSWCREDFIYRQHRDRAAHRGHRRRAIQAAYRGRRRKVTDHRVRGYADRGCRRMDPVRRILQSGRGL